MQDLMSKFLAQLHVIIILYGAWGAYSVYEEHDVAMAQIEEQFPITQEAIKSAEEKLNKIDEFRKNLDQSRLRVTEVFNNISQVQKQLPSEISDIEILDFFSKEAKSLNIPEIESTPNTELPMGFYISKPYSIKARGTFLQFVVFLERIEAAERLFNIKSLILRSENDVQKTRFRVVSLELLVDTFKYNSRHQETSGVENLAAPADSATPRRRPRKRDKGT
jgi:Tfp pilus assembly protein PilO